MYGTNSDMPLQSAHATVQTVENAPSRVAIVTTWGGSMAGLRRDVVPWMQLMTELGVSRFYVRPCLPHIL